MITAWKFSVCFMVLYIADALEGVFRANFIPGSIFSPMSIAMMMGISIVVAFMPTDFSR